MSTTLLQVPRTAKQRSDAKAILNGIDTPTTGTRRRNKQRLDKDDIPQDTIEEGSAQGVWLDGPLALTLLPPLGSFLTGGDFIRDGIILALLFYYLRALIKTPWELYTKARARRSPPTLQVDDEDDQEPDDIRSIRAMARSELRFAEIIYLALCLLTPFLGVLLLRHGATLLGADNSLTWFSTGLFVLATGLRPWRHLVQLLTTRTDALHDIVHHPIVPAAQSSTAMATERFERIEEIMDELRASHEKHEQWQVQAAAQAGPASSEMQTVLARIEESIEHLEEQSRNTTRAGELVRLDSEEKYTALQKALEGLVTEVAELHQRVTTAATTAAAASATATAAAESAHNAAARPLHQRKPSSLAWAAPTAISTGPWPPIGGRDASSSSRTGAAKRRPSLVAQVMPAFQPQDTFREKIIHFVAHLVLIPIKIFQNLLHRIIAALGVAAEPTSPTLSKEGISVRSPPPKSTKPLSPKGKQKTL